MNDIKKLFTDKIVEPAADSRSSSTIIGEVIESYETKNTCKVKFTNSKGNNEIRNNLMVFTYNKSVIDWFPKVKDKVLLQENNKTLFIIGPAELDHSTLRAKLKLENDIYSDSFISTIGGYVF